MSQKTENIILILLLGGSGSRFGAPVPKQYLKLGGSKDPLYIQTAKNFHQALSFSQMVLVGHPDYLESKVFLEPLFEFQRNFPDIEVTTASGGATRHLSFRNGATAVLKMNSDGTVLVHDANRPYIDKSFSKNILEASSRISGKTPCMIPVTPSTDSLCQTEHDRVIRYVQRDTVCKIQTPQMIHLPSMRLALEKSMTENSFDYTDEGSFMLAMGFPVNTYDGSPANIKITYPEDL